MFFCEKFGWTVDQVMGHSRSELEIILQVLDKREKTKDKTTRESPQYTSELEQYNIKKLQKMSTMRKNGIV